jgi:signal transduction histidine kinase
VDLTYQFTMNIYNRKIRWKFLLFFIAAGIGISSLWYTNILVRKLAIEEHKKVELWAKATSLIANSDLPSESLEFMVSVIQNNETVPVILVDKDTNIIQKRNLDSLKSTNPEYLKHKLKEMMEENPPIEIPVLDNNKQYLYYSRSTILTKLIYYPLIQFGVIFLFIIVAYFAFSSSRKAEQNQVWVGLSKETAHQLGTPISSLMAWLEILKLRDTEKGFISELEKDVLRLNKITERFSKIGSKPSLKPENLINGINNTISYLRTRSSKKVIFNLYCDSNDIVVPLNTSLFEWVIENVCKNSIDAIEGEGTINVKVTENPQLVFVDIIDSGKGIQKSKHKTIFKPGFTTKERGWGLGLSLTKRIIEEYHNGKIFVSASEIGKGTTIRIILKK